MDTSSPGAAVSVCHDVLHLGKEMPVFLSNLVLRCTAKDLLKPGVPHVYGKGGDGLNDIDRDSAIVDLASHPSFFMKYINPALNLFPPEEVFPSYHHLVRYNPPCNDTIVFSDLEFATIAKALDALHDKCSVLGSNACFDKFFLIRFPIFCVLRIWHCSMCVVISSSLLQVGQMAFVEY